MSSFADCGLPMRRPFAPAFSIPELLLARIIHAIVSQIRFCTPHVLTNGPGRGILPASKAMTGKSTGAWFGAERRRWVRAFAENAGKSPLSRGLNAIGQ